jgi:hypothetical protein
MAEEAKKHSWQRTCLGCALYPVLFLGIVWFAIAVEQRGFDPHRLCGQTASGECLSTETGVVRSTQILFEDVRVAYDDGRKSVDVLIEDEKEPSAGTRVVLEWWDGDVVALVDRESGQRYKTSDWPDPWWDWLAVFGVLVAMVGLAVGLFFGVVLAVQRLRRRRR